MASDLPSSPAVRESLPISRMFTTPCSFSGSPASVSTRPYLILPYICPTITYQIPPSTARSTISRVRNFLKPDFFFPPEFFFFPEAPLFPFIPPPFSFSGFCFFGGFPSSGPVRSGKLGPAFFRFASFFPCLTYLSCGLSPYSSSGNGALR